MPEPLSRLDLNLLVALNVLLEECNVSKSAHRLNITQPAMSNTLSRLRTMFDDPLFTRSSHGIAPTPKALALKERLPGLLDQVESFVINRPFDPLLCDKRIRIGMPEPLGQTFFPKLLSVLQDRAPRLRISAFEPTQDVYPQMKKGEVDYVVQTRQKLPHDVDAHLLGVMQLKLWMRKDHPLLKKAPSRKGVSTRRKGQKTTGVRKKKLSVQQCLTYPYVDLRFHNVGGDKKALLLPTLGKQGLERQVVFVTSNLLTALNAIKHTDHLLILSDQLCDLEFVEERYEILDLPKEFRFGDIEMHLISHQRFNNSPLHQWLTSVLLETFTQ